MRQRDGVYNFSILFLWLIMLTNSTLKAQSSTYDTIRGKLPMYDFLGTNSFIDAPVGKLKPVGWIREYHNWGFNEISNDVFEYNRWNGFWNFDKFYQDLKNADIMACPVYWASPGWLQPNSNYRPLIDDAEDPFIPYSYRELSEALFQFAARYGAREVDYDSLMVNEGQIKRSGLNLVHYLEDWNEQNKDWEGEKAYFKPGHYAAMASANVDGHCGTMGPGYGMKQADPTMNFVMGGLAGTDTSYLAGMLTWFRNNRPDSAWPIDVINVHHYAFIRNATGISPEEDNYKGVIQKVVKWKDDNVPESEVWLTEFGYDSNSSSMNRAPIIGDYTRQEVQAIWNMRTFLILSSTGIERAAHFMIRNADDPNQPRYSSCGLTTSKEDGHQPKVSWYYLLTMNNILGELHFERVISESESLYFYKYSNPVKDTAVYAAWHPSVVDTSASFTFTTDIQCDSVTLIQFKNESETGERTLVNYDSAGIELPISQSPLFIQVIRDTIPYVPDTTLVDPDTTIVDPDTTITDPDTTITDPDTTLFSVDHTDFSESGFRIYPNPVKQNLYIEKIQKSRSPAEVKIIIYNLSGKEVLQHSGNLNQRNKKLLINLNGIVPGYYILQIEFDHHKFSRGLIID